MTDIARHYLVERCWNGQTHYAVEHDDLAATVREVKSGRAKRSEISICEWMMVEKSGIAFLVRRRLLAREVVRA